MHKMRVMTVVGTRPEIIRLSRTIALLDVHCEHILVHTGQNYAYELNQVFFEQLGIRAPDVFLDAAGENAAETIGNVISQVDHVLERYQPEAVLILGDTNSCLAAISAKRRKIPVFHMEAGNRCFDFRVPEEINRRIVDHVSDVNLPYTQIAREYLLREGLPADQIICTGSPVREVLEFYAEGIKGSKILEELGLESGKYFLCSFHREENVDKPESLKKLLAILDHLADHYSLPIVVSTHPRTQKKLDLLGEKSNDLVRFLPPFGFLDYVHLQMHARCVMSDSGTITEEASILNFPAINVREVHERPEGFEEGAVMFTGLDVDRVSQAVSILESQGRGDVRDLKVVRDYEADNVSQKVLRIILSYTGFINRKVWRR